jgi:hypothetical protein
MTYADRKNPSKKIEILFPIDVIKIISSPPIEYKRLFVIIGHAGD